MTKEVAQQRQSNGIRPPDFIVCGGIADDGRAILYASRNLKRAQLEETSHYEPPCREWFGPPLELDHNIQMSADMHDYVVIAADTYPEAWQGLFNYWAEEDRQKDEIDSGTKAIDRG